MRILGDIWVDLLFAVLLIYTAFLLFQWLCYRAADFAIDSYNSQFRRSWKFWAKAGFTLFMGFALIMAYGGIGVYKLGDLLGYLITGN